MIEIDHGNGPKTRYGHLSKIEVTAGDTLSRGQLIAYVGSTGPHLHNERALNDMPINPRALFTVGTDGVEENSELIQFIATYLKKRASSAARFLIYREAPL